MKRIALLLVGCLLYSVSAFAQAGAAGTLNSYVTGTLQSGATANGNGTALAVRGLSAALVTVNCSVGCSGGTTVNLELTEDGTNFSAAFGQQLGTSTIASTIVNQNTTPTIWEVNVAGAQSLRARISAYSAGTITVTATAIAAPFDPKVVNSNQAGTWTVQPGNTANTTAWKVDGSAVTQPVSGTVTTTPPSNASTNVAQVAGTTADTNSGNKSAGTLRVVLATDQPALTNKLLVTPDSVALPANQSVNAAQFGGTNVSTGTGAGGAGIPRVTVSNDSSMIGTLSDSGAAAGTNRFATLPAIARSNLPSAKTAGRDSSLNTDLQGNLFVAQMPNTSTTTYAASKVGLVPAASPTDIAVLSGNATNTVIITGINMSCTQTTAGIIDVRLLLRTTADSGGTSTGSPTAYPLDSNNAGAVSAVLTYTANPTVNDGTDRVIDSQKVAVLAPATATPNDMYLWRPTMGQSLVLRGTAQQAALNLNAVTLTGGSCDIRYSWIETTGL